jgi:hypothetical protein
VAIMARYKILHSTGCCNIQCVAPDEVSWKVVFGGIRRGNAIRDRNSHSVGLVLLSHDCGVAVVAR